jgi:putative redox protein
MPMDAKVQWMPETLTFSGVSDSNHWIVMDTGADAGGAQGACTPLELVLLGLGGCTAMDVVSILKKMQVPLKGLEIRLHADRSEEHPKVFTRIRLEYRFSGGGIDPEKVNRAVGLSMAKYCSVSAMLGKAAEIEHAVVIQS